MLDGTPFLKLKRKPVIDRRTLIFGMAAVAVSPAVAPSHPLPGDLTPSILRELADDCRNAIARLKPRVIGGIDRMPYMIDQLTMQANVFDRMALCSQPFETLDNELYARGLAIQRDHNYVPA